MTVIRRYDVIYFGKTEEQRLEELTVSCREAGSVLWGDWEIAWQARPCGVQTLCIRSRQTGDTVRLPGGSKSVKKLFIDKKIPADCRERLPVVLCNGQIVAVADFVKAEGITIKERER